MNNQRKEQLQKRRASLQQELKLKKQRERISPQIRYLKDAGYAYEIFYEHEHLSWIFNTIRIRKKDGYHGIHDDFQIDVKDSEAEQTIFVKDAHSLMDSFNRAFPSNIYPDEKLIVCTLGGDPELEIPAAALLSNPDLFLSGFETWVLTSEKNWIIEYIGEQEIIRFINLSQTKPVLKKKLVIREER